MAFRYYDHLEGRERLKPRYKWAALAFVAGLATGILFAHIL
jgi:hypothetical protein